MTDVGRATFLCGLFCLFHHSCPQIFITFHAFFDIFLFRIIFGCWDWNSQVEDAEEEAREALDEATDLVTDSDVLAVLLTVFKADREYAIHGEDTWDRPLEYCKRICSLCDRNFLSGGGQPRPGDFPVRVVASVYAECGRSYALAPEQTASSLDLLQKALNVFALIAEPNMEEALEISACRASLARVLRRVGQVKKAQDEFLQAMQLLAGVPDSFEVPGLVTEYSETLAAAGDEAVASPALLDLITLTLHWLSINFWRL